MARGKTAEKGKILERQTMALDWRKQGKSYRWIADKLGVSHQQVFRDIQDELKRLADLNQDSAAELRQLELERLDRIIDSLDNWVMAGNTGAAMAVLRAMERRAKLLGLDAPEQKDVKVSGTLTWADVVKQAKQNTDGSESDTDT